MSYLDIVAKQLGVDEGKRNLMYIDSLGVPTIGKGHNLRDRPISDHAIEVIFADDMADSVRDAKSLFPNFDLLTDTRKAVLVNMAFNLGHSRLSGFKKFILAVGQRDYETAANEMLDSLWSRQVGARAKRLSDDMRNG